MNVQQETTADAPMVASISQAPIIAPVLME